LPYLSALGVDALWISPIFTSPMIDFGYDIADYENIDPIFGSLADFDALLATAHEHGLKIILDLVPNHTSNRHVWFEQSRSSRDNHRRDWYIWHDPNPGGGPPNNWLSEFGGSAWELDQRTGQYYYHAFLKQQPDLNWRNPDIRRAIYDVMRFWLRRGVDGFRVDVLWRLIKDDQFRDNPPNPGFREGDPPHRAHLQLYTADRPEMPELVAEMRRVIDEFPNRALIGEIYLPIERLVAYYGKNLEGTHLPFNFSLLFAAWNACSIASLIEEYEAALPPGGWPNWVLGNHDRPRIASRVGPQGARLAVMLLLTLRGTPTVYYGDEIGLEQIMVPIDQARDPVEWNVPGLRLGRDGCRSPMQWDGTPYAGFSSVKPWLPVEETFAQKNVACLQQDPTSIYRLYRELLALRRSCRALTLGAFQGMPVSGDLVMFIRAFDGERLLIVLNFGSAPVMARLLCGATASRVILSSKGDRGGEIVGGSILLRPHEGVIIDSSELVEDRANASGRRLGSVIARDRIPE
jgi:alpha-glucosidase